MHDQEKNWILMTGVTRGIGRSLAEILRQRGISVCGLVRPAKVQQVSGWLDAVVPWELELPWAENSAETLFSTLSGKRVIGFVHAAGVLGPMDDVPDAGNVQAWVRWWSASAAAHRVNHASGMEILTAVLPKLSAWKNTTGKRSSFVAHLSSGAALKPYVGWNAYCASKAAILMDFKCLAAKIAAGQTTVLSVAPGTVMTDMMKQVLASDPSAFPALPKFKSLEQSGGLVAPEVPAGQIITWMLDSSQQQIEAWHGEFYDVRTNNSLTK
ncbi:MAG: SDR family NAD(P)-dependent oxidoreductase [Betaproteobacteria bacterium]|nr:SDR family NAD(P)-dependent oxidoreductase [Betaproteobacteria bacterium]